MPRMAAPNAPRRLPAPPTLHLSPPQTSPDVSAPVFHPAGLGDEFGSYGGLGGARQLWDGQAPWLPQDVTHANKFAQNAGLHGLQRLDGAGATTWGQIGPTDYSAFMRDAPNALDDSGHWQQYVGAVDYDAHAPSASPYAASSQLSESESSDSSGPIGFVAGQPLLWQAINNSANHVQHSYAPPHATPHTSQQGAVRFQGPPRLPYNAPHPPTVHNGPWAAEQPSPYSTHPATENLEECLTLAMLCDPASPDEKPNYPYPTLIRAAILGSPRKALTLQGIYDALEARFEWFREHRDDKAWKNSIRHNLSLNKLFRRLERPPREPGKGCYWTVDLAAGEGTKRERRRTKRAGLAEKTRLAAAAAADDEAKAKEKEKARRAERRGGSEEDACMGSAPLRAGPVLQGHSANLNHSAEPYPGQPTISLPMNSMSTLAARGPPTWGTAPSEPQPFGYLFSPRVGAYGAGVP